MPSIKTQFKLTNNEIGKINRVLSNGWRKENEQTISYTIHTFGEKLMLDNISKYVPRSNVEKKNGNKHAADVKWYDVTRFWLGVRIENKSKYYYLYYPHEGAGTSKRNEPNPFMKKGMNDSREKIVDEIVKAIKNNYEKELK